MTVSKEFADRIAATFDSDGEEWLVALPTILQEISRKWSLTIQHPFEGMAYNYVVPVIRGDGSRAVLKVGVPNPELQTEIEALRIFDGKGMVKLLEADSDAGAMLLERLEPGRPLVELDDDRRATRVACQVMLDLQRTSSGDGPFPTVSDWAKGFDRLRSKFDGDTGPFPQRLVEQAESDLRELLKSSNKSTLLHGDLHHWNILSAQRAPWLAIDPKGLIGEPEYETGAWLRNPFPALLKWTEARQVIKRRIDQFAMELGFDRERILAWGIYQAVLAGWWSYEERNQDWKKWVAIAELIAGSENVRRTWGGATHV